MKLKHFFFLEKTADAFTPPNMANLSTFQQYCILLCVIPNLPCKTTPKPLQAQCLKRDILFWKTSCEYFIVRLVINEVASGSKDSAGRAGANNITSVIQYPHSPPPPSPKKETI